MLIPPIPSKSWKKPDFGLFGDPIRQWVQEICHERHEMAMDFGPGWSRGGKTGHHPNPEKDVQKFGAEALSMGVEA